MFSKFQPTKDTPEFLEFLRARDSADAEALHENQVMEATNDTSKPKNLLGPKEIKIGIASVLELKAELSKRESQVSQGKLNHQTGNVKEKVRFKGMDPNEKIKLPVYAKPGSSSRNLDRNRGIEARNARDEAHPNHDEKSKLEASWVALQRKAQIYDQMQEDGGVDDENEEVLVDFLTKHMAQSQNHDESRRSSRRKIDHLSTTASRKGEWVQVADEFGRDRLVRADEAEEIKKATQQQSYIEQLRYQDNEEMQQALADERENSERSRETLFHRESNSYIPSKGDHFDSKWEKRNLGVGFYQFDTTDGAKREQQMLEINNLREETIETRNRLEIQKLKRKEKNESRTAMLKERAKKRKVEEAERSGETFLAGLFDGGNE